MAFDCLGQTGNWYHVLAEAERVSLSNARALGKLQ